MSTASWMGFRRRFSSFVRGQVAVLVVALTVIGCGHSETVRVRAAETSEVPLSEFVARDFGPGGDLRLDVGTMAALAALAYEDGGTEERIARLRKWLEDDGWGQLTDWRFPEVCNVGLHDFGYQAWGKLDAADPLDARGFLVLSIRGTSSLSDWCSNLRFLPVPGCPRKSDQYLYIAQVVDDALRTLRDEVGDFDTYSVLVGHSLGAGLAELGGRASYIDLVFSFDSSPVIGARAARRLEEAFADPDEYDRYVAEYEERTGCSFYPDNPPDAENLVIERVYEHGEALAYPRLLKRVFLGRSRANPTENEYRVDLLSGNPIEQHGMVELACALLARGDDSGPGLCEAG